MNANQKESFCIDAVRYNIEIYFDQPYYYSSEKVRCYVKMNYQKNLSKKTGNNSNNKDDEVENEELLDYVIIQLYGFATYSDDLLDIFNSNPAPINQLFSNIINFRNKSNRAINCKNKTIFTSNPYILASDIKLVGSEGNIGTFTYTCHLPPFIPPTYNGRYISFNYITLITIGINNIKFNNTNINEQNGNDIQTNLNLPIIQKKVKFDIKCLGPHPNSLKLQLNQFQCKNQHYFPMTAMDKNYIDNYENNNTIEKIPSLTETDITNSGLNNNFNIELFNSYSNNQVLENILNIYNRKVHYLNKIMSQNESYIYKLRFFESSNGINIYNYLNNHPKSFLELSWENETSIINYPMKLLQNTDKNKRNNTENLTINYKNKLVLNCNIKNLNNWTEKSPIILHFDFSNCIWKTQEIQVIINRIENIENSSNNQNNIRTTTVYEYKRCNIWDLEFTHQIQPIFSNTIQSINTNSISIYYQLCIYFFIFDFEKKRKKINYLNVNRFSNIIKLSWKSSKLDVLPKYDQIDYKYSELLDSQNSINSINFNQIASILPNNFIYDSKYIKF
ncbi:hypothetical protein RS030_203194 [Cryptosporidium xiaoi]|uniref:Arrestin-like N-terminal domain-containing protein n=1 Tax=Cryptosporidium xiaoi TaxID=659607 RepID=A0AAV9XY54_9CRYT